MKTKELIYAKYISQLEETYFKGFYFEAAWIQYVLLEDRLVSLLKNSGGNLDAKNKEIRMMGPKLGKLVERCSTSSVLKNELDRDDLINKLDTWKNLRNTLMHSMVDGSQSIKQIENDIQELAETGITLVRNTASAARRIKKINKKTPI
ncbi:hypothetical protein [Flavobacterium sp. N1736]|uniref:hypothetical protein n=1 Tax=Flavobacterium sp. N1736 TaxID=2986823 RepID=UPI0022241FE1|nr:hypothetical protein [Flavobacterium sp. N1736]